jgi:hypothetical protein
MIVALFTHEHTLSHSTAAQSAIVMPPENEKKEEADYNSYGRSKETVSMLAVCNVRLLV